MQQRSSSLITVLCVNYNTSDFIEVMLYSFEKLTSSPFEVLIVDNGSKESHLLRLAKAAQNYNNVRVIYRRQSAPGSIGHGEAMDLLVKMVDTPYFVTMDSDAAFLIKDWDIKLLSRLNERTKAIGTQAPGDKPKDFPLMFAVLYETEAFLRSGANFLPFTKFDCKNNLLDTGWAIRESFHKNGYFGDVLVFKNTRHWKSGPYSKMLAAEFYLNDESDIFASHFGRGSTGGLAKINYWWRKIPLIGPMYARYVSLKERRNWINTTRTMVNCSVIKK